MHPDVQMELKYTIFLPPETIVLFGAGFYYMAVKERVNMTALREEALNQNDPESPDYVPFWYIDNQDLIEEHNLTNYHVRTMITDCRFWNETTGSWEQTGCRVHPRTNTKEIWCSCNHLTSFGSDFFVPPNTIDFKAAFSNLDAKLKSNFGVLVMICTVFGLYVIVVIWARRKDKQDVIRWGVTPLDDNLASETYYYEITVYTGTRRGAGTKSNISFVLSGDVDDTGVRKLADGVRQGHESGSIIRYVLSVPSSLGALNYLRIWHDNSGGGANSSWYLNRIIVQDLQNGSTFFFLCNDWLAVDEGDGLVDRLVPVAGYKDITSFGNLFSSISRKNLTDSHLWVSVFSRPERSNFTRVQRVSVIMALLFMTMMVNAMFYERRGVKVATIKLGPLTITTYQLWVSICGSFIVLPPSVLMDQIFRKTRPKPSKTGPLWERRRQQLEGTSLDKPETSDHRTVSPTEVQCEVSSRPQSQTTDSLKPRKKKKRMFPHWFLYIGWFLYAVGKEKSESWLKAIFLSVFESVLLVQPLKVFIIAAVISIIFKKPDYQDARDDDSIMNNLPQDDEELLSCKPKEGHRTKIEIAPMDPEVLRKAREQRMKEREMMAVLKDICLYMIFLSLLLYVAHQHRNLNAFWVNKDLKNTFEESGFTSISDPDSFWTWIDEALLPGLFATEHYNAEPLIGLDTAYMSNLVSFRVGAPRIRQLRVKQDGCRVSKMMKRVIDGCYLPYSFFNEEKSMFQKHWEKVNESDISSIPSNSPWIYKDIFELKGLPHVGTIETYNAGGYVADLTGPL
ncbi:polycystin-1-like protein 2 [Tachypleus tridentatus]|uniref:polycystin-1-like protein 2 n=1 Tax=Tachypleus tridentatus TaxID=6853 RepID=UPI003FCEE8F0